MPFNTDFGFLTFKKCNKYSDTLGVGFHWRNLFVKGFVVLFFFSLEDVFHIIMFTQWSVWPVFCIAIQCRRLTFWPWPSWWHFLSQIFIYKKQTCLCICSHGLLHCHDSIPCFLWQSFWQRDVITWLNFTRLSSLSPEAEFMNKLKLLLCQDPLTSLSVLVSYFYHAIWLARVFCQM